MMLVWIVLGVIASLLFVFYPLIEGKLKWHPSKKNSKEVHIHNDNKKGDSNIGRTILIGIWMLGGLVWRVVQERDVVVGILYIVRVIIKRPLIVIGCLFGLFALVRFIKMAWQAD